MEHSSNLYSLLALMFFFIYILWNISMESVKGNLTANKLIVDKLQLTTQWSTSQRWKQRIKALFLGIRKEAIACCIDQQCFQFYLSADTM